MNIDAVERSHAAHRSEKSNNSRLRLDSQIVRAVNCRLKSNVTSPLNADQRIPSHRNRTIEVNIIVFGSDIPIINSYAIFGIKSQ